MQLFHLGDSHFAEQMNGEGARLFGGRWNETGDACIYTSATRSLAILEYVANVRLENIPPALSITGYSVPAQLCRWIEKNDLPEDWQSIPPPLSTRSFGSRLLADKEYACFAVPSVIVPAEFNFILNPAAELFSQVKVISVEEFVLDIRIKK